MPPRRLLNLPSELLRVRRKDCLCLVVAISLALTSCSAFGQESTQDLLATGPSDLAVTTPIATTAPIAFPTAAPTATPQPAAAQPPAEPTVAPTNEPAQVAPTAVEPTPSQTEPTSTVEVAPTAIPTAVEQPVVVAPTTIPTQTPAAAIDQSFGAASADTLGRTVTTAGYVLLGAAGGVPVISPAARVELIGYHEAGHPGAQGLDVVESGLPSMVLETRFRSTHPRSASDIVVPPDEPIRAPVTGTVIASNAYVLYCKHDDKLVYIEPDGRPGWQVRLFHIRGTTPAVGTRVIAGETQIADAAFELPFESQIDEFTAEPSWPHVHIEVVDTSVPDDRPAGPGCP